MKYFRLDIGVLNNDGFCFLSEPPEGTNAYTHRMAQGYSMGKHFPRQPRARMSKKYGGSKLPSLVGNTDSFLIVSGEVKKVIERVNHAQTEYLRFSLCYQNGRLASDNYYIINILGTFDCLNLNKSKIDYYKGEIVEIEEFILDVKKMKKAPHLFRIKEAPEQYVIDEKMLNELRKLKPTNMYAYELKQSN